MDPVPVPPMPSLTKTWHSAPYAAIDPTQPKLSSKGKTVVITGGATGIGAAIARAFAAAGASRIAIMSRTEKNLLAAKATIEATFPATKVLTPTADVSKEDQVDAAFDAVKKEFGTIDIMVSNSAFMATNTSLAAADVKDWWTTYETNVLGAMLVTRAFLRNKSEGAFLLNISSGVAHMPGMGHGISAYASSKSASTKLFEYVAVEEQGVHVVNVQPGIVDSELNRKSTIPGMDDGEFIVLLCTLFR
jgi:NAD(P)-dependent dehydrogenase (short-subunit alcohol dehydrogenase family)